MSSQIKHSPGNPGRFNVVWASFNTLHNKINPYKEN
ncbi:DUF4014 family protein [Escherichia coli O111:H8]